MGRTTYGGEREREIVDTKNKVSCSRSQEGPFKESCCCCCCRGWVKGTVPHTLYILLKLVGQHLACTDQTTDCGLSAFLSLSLAYFTICFSDLRLSGPYSQFRGQLLIQPCLGNGPAVRCPLFELSRCLPCALYNHMVLRSTKQMLVSVVFRCLQPLKWSCASLPNVHYIPMYSVGWRRSFSWST